jgi:uncharacterized surface protein with fasciclin (FAS1) repeats
MKLRWGVGICAALLAMLSCANQRLLETPAASSWGQRSRFDANFESHGGAWGDRREADATALSSPHFKGGRGAQWQSKRATEPGMRSLATVGKGTQWYDSRGVETMNVLESSPALEAFTGALKRTGVDKELEEQRELTILAPNDFAFEQMSTEAHADLFGPNGREQLRDLVRRHIVPGKYDSQELSEAGEVTTLAGTKVAIESTAGLPQPGGAQVLSSTGTRGGVVHQIDRVLSP